MTNQPPPTIGWRERVDLPDWGLSRVRAKIDTGARTSAIDVAQVEQLPNGDIRFEVVARVKPERVTRWIEATPVRSSIVKPSSGQKQTRYVCETTFRIAEHEFTAEISLVCRKGMLARMLVGRTALANRFIVDPAQKNLISKRKAKTKTERPGA